MHDLLTLLGLALLSPLFFFLGIPDLVGPDEEPEERD